MAQKTQKLIDDIVAVLDACDLKKIANIDQETKRKFATHVIKNLAAQQQIARDRQKANNYDASLAKLARAANKHLKAYYDLRFREAKNINIAARQGLKDSHYSVRAALEKIIKSFDKESKVTLHQKTGKDNTEAVLIAKMIARNYKNILGSDPTHNHHFQTYGHDEKTWDTVEKSNITSFDHVCLIISRSTKVQFSEPTLRKVISTRSQSVVGKRGALSQNKLG